MEYKREIEEVTGEVYVLVNGKKVYQVEEKTQADIDFNNNCNLYRSQVQTKETWEQRKKRINGFRCG